MINKCTLVGNVGGDPDIRNLDNGIKVANFSLATTEKWKDKEGVKQEATEWHRIVAWRGLAEVIEKYVKKGSQVYVEGKIKTRMYTDKSGVDKYTTEILIDVLKLLGRKSEGGSIERAEGQATSLASGGDNYVGKVTPDGGNENLDDLPF